VPGTKTASVASLPDPRSMEALFEAQQLMYEAFEARGARRAALAALARRALTISADCADAYLLLAEETASTMAEEAVEHQRELLRLNPNDNQGLRDRQAEWLLWLERYEELDALFAAYDEDGAAALVYTKALAAFRREGASPGAGQLLDDAREANPPVVAYLTGRKVLPKRLPDDVGFGDESEAVDYTVGAAALWASVPGALAWLES